MVKSQKNFRNMQKDLSKTKAGENSPWPKHWANNRINNLFEKTKSCSFQQKDERYLSLEEMESLIEIVNIHPVDAISTGVENFEAGIPVRVQIPLWG